MKRLVTYSASSSENEEENSTGTDKIIKVKKLRLPCAINQLGAPMKDENEEMITANPELHQNRIRNFKHERGNWATFVYVPADNIFDEISELCQQELKSLVELHVCDDFHLTLSKTVVLQYHLIDNFVKSLENALTESRFTAFLGPLEVYINEDKTRTFIGFKVLSPKLFDLLKKVNAVMRDFKLSEFYEDPSFHISFVWCLGNKFDLIQKELQRLMTAINTIAPHNLLDSISVKKLSCKIGHKIYNFKLS